MSITHQEIKRRVVQANERAQYWLSVANIAIENGKSRSIILKAERKAQFWLDRLNRLENKG